MREEQLRRMTSERVTKEIEPLKALIPEGKFLALWGYTLSNESYQLLIAPWPLEYLEEQDPITGKPKVRNRKTISSPVLKEFELKIKTYLDEHGESNIH